ncbi:hypothetical protein NPIL_13891 [Nephila pilipes]|uniref:Uncharacterized protein n=1 Tax=Nephila pilipes TaxID=299642 RepID=A0A8X6JQR0_NEPPI|nr:hypothetical protein NPIL_13891 [Nephila pilipes]
MFQTHPAEQYVEGKSAVISCYENDTPLKALLMFGIKGIEETTALKISPETPSPPAIDQTIPLDQTECSLGSTRADNLPRQNIISRVTRTLSQKAILAGLGYQLWSLLPNSLQWPSTIIRY